MIREKINTQRGHWLFEGRGLITKCFFFLFAYLYFLDVL